MHVKMLRLFGEGVVLHVYLRYVDMKNSQFLEMIDLNYFILLYHSSQIII